MSASTDLDDLLIGLLCSISFVLGQMYGPKWYGVLLFASGMVLGRYLIIAVRRVVRKRQSTKGGSSE